MKHKLSIMAIILSLLLIFVGCEDEKVEIHTCAKCGKEATHTVLGTAEYLQNNYGVSLSRCKMITSDTYSVYLCNECDTTTTVRVMRP